MFLFDTGLLIRIAIVQVEGTSVVRTTSCKFKKNSCYECVVSELQTLDSVSFLCPKLQ